MSFNEINKKTVDEINNRLQDRVSRVRPLMVKCFELLSKSELYIKIKEDEENNKEQEKCYEPIAAELLLMAGEKDLKILDINFLCSLLQTSLENVKNILNYSAQTSIAMANEKIWGKPESEITMGEVHNILTDKTKINIEKK